MKLRPLHDRIVVKRIETEGEKTAAGIVIPDSAKEKPQEAKVIAVGKGKRLESGEVVPLDVKVGDRILFGKYSGSEITLGGEEYIIMREDEVLASLSHSTVAVEERSSELLEGAEIELAVSELPGDPETPVLPGEPETEVLPEDPEAEAQR